MKLKKININLRISISHLLPNSLSKDKLGGYHYGFYKSIHFNKSFKISLSISTLRCNFSWSYRVFNISLVMLTKISLKELSLVDWIIRFFEFFSVISIIKAYILFH